VFSSQPRRSPRSRRLRDPRPAAGGPHPACAPSLPFGKRLVRRRLWRAADDSLQIYRRTDHESRVASRCDRPTPPGAPDFASKSAAQKAYRNVMTASEPFAPGARRKRLAGRQYIPISARALVSWVSTRDETPNLPGARFAWEAAARMGHQGRALGLRRADRPANRRPASGRAWGDAEAPISFGTENRQNMRGKPDLSSFVAAGAFRESSPRPAERRRLAARKAPAFLPLDGAPLRPFRRPHESAAWRRAPAPWRFSPCGGARHRIRGVARRSRRRGVRQRSWAK
jgi:hypothetical protein